MSTWLDPVRRVLAERPTPVTIFFRDDDAGWEDEALYRLVETFVGCQAPIALAAIPVAVSSGLAVVLRTYLAELTPMVSVHQHGFAHVNHEPDGRKCEFGPSRSHARQRCDLAAGRDRLQQALGRELPPIFTPPWNRCTRDTAECLVDLGYQVLSRDASAEGLGLAPLRELQVQLDWSGRRGAHAGAAHWGESIARAIGRGGTVGIMLHHAVMTADERGMLRDLLDALGANPDARVRSMTDIVVASNPPGGIPSCAP
jgi:hypothetical protein